MISVQQSYILGYFPQVIGFYFNGMEILSRFQVETQEQLKLRVESLMESWRPLRAPETMNQIRRVEITLQLLGLAAPTPPQLPEEYFRWAENIMAQTNRILTISSQNSPERIEQKLDLFRRKWTYAFASKLGDFIHTMDLGALVNHLLGSKATNTFLVAQRIKLEEMSQEILRQLKMIEERTHFLRTFPEATQQMIVHATHMLELAPSIASTNDPDTLAAALQKTVSNVLALAIEKQFNF